jgi:hypothetical protein
MATCASIGQAAGTAAALCVAHSLTPRALCHDKARLAELQQTLLRDDQTIKNVTNTDTRDLARSAKVTASAERNDSPAASVVHGPTRAIPGGPTNRWAAEMASPDGAWLMLEWDAPRTIREVQIVFDTGFQRELTLSKSDDATKGTIRAPQPETVRDYTLSYRPVTDAPDVVLATVRGNHQRVNRLTFAPVKARALRIAVHATNGDPLARIFEVRCYG